MPVERRIARAILELAEEFGGDLAASPAWQSRLQLVLGAMRGLALTEQFEPREYRRRDRWKEVRAALLEAFGDAAAT